jgi:hypothetical protein
MKKKVKIINRKGHHFPLGLIVYIQIPPYNSEFFIGTDESGLHQYLMQENFCTAYEQDPNTIVI